MPLILNVRVDSATTSQALARVEAMLCDERQHIITTPNPEMIVAAQNDPEFRAVLNQTSLALPDGFGLMLAARFIGIPLAERISGVDFIWHLARLAGKKGYSLCLAGGKNNVAKRTTDKIVSELPNPPIIRALPEPEVEAIQAFKPDILLIALGHGRQEKWIAEHLHEMSSVKIAMGVGGAFDFISGQVRRAPLLLRRLGIEWLWRLMRQPWRIPRIYRAVVKFPFMVLREKYAKSY